MEAPVAYPVQLDFRITILEATQVPKECRTLEVTWKKGAKCLVTRPALVHKGRAEWNEELVVSAALCRVAGQAHFQAKHCWLQVSSQDGTVLGCDKVNLADCGDGQVKDRTLQIWKAHASSLGIKLKVSIQALGGLHGQEVVPPVFPRRSSSPHRPSSSSEGRSVKTFRALSDLSPEAETPGRGTPGASPMMRALQRPRIISNLNVSQLELDALEASSQHAASSKELAPRLVMLCNRQLLNSQLSVAEQEEAIAEFIQRLRRSREHGNLESCGLLFKAPLQGRVPLILEEPAAAGQGAPLPPSVFSPPLYLDLEMPARKSELGRPLAELEEHLQAARGLALSLAHEPPVPSPLSPCSAPEGHERPQATGVATPQTWNARSFERNVSEAAREGEVSSKIQDAIDTALCVSRITESLDCAGALSRQAMEVIEALQRKLQEMSKDRELWIHRCLAEKELQKANSLCKRGLHERSVPSCVECA